MARRGFFAELHHQAKVAAREQARAEREAERARKAAILEAERARKARQRAAAQLARATEAERKRLEKEAREAHVVAMEKEADRKNLELSQVYHEIDSLLAATLEVDDYVDLNSLRMAVNHFPFDRSDLETPILSPSLVRYPPKPTLIQPTPPQGLMSLFGKKKHAKALAEATEAHECAVAIWQAELAQLDSAQEEAESKHAEMEAQRIADLEVERARYEAECSAREVEAAEHNKGIDTMIASLGYGVVDAVQDYVSIVLANSVYPVHFPIDHEFSFEAETAELRLRILMPSPESFPDTKIYKYIKSADEIRATALSQKACRDRYSSAVNQVALRSIHEIFEADRRGLIKTISLEVGTETPDPATGIKGYILFVAVGAERDSFIEMNLSNVIPSATLDHLGAVLSKNPFGLVAANSSGIRRS